ncbi:phenylpyruvate tautomerase [Gammaproteobacteria bacterium]
MPVLTIHTNVELNLIIGSDLLKKASGLVAGLLSKPEGYVLVRIEGSKAMSFAGSSDPLAYLELKSIGFPKAKAAEISKSLCDLMQNELGIAANRTYIEFSNAEGSMWGWNGATF